MSGKNRKLTVSTDAERIEKFLERVGEVLQSPIWTDRDPEDVNLTVVTGKMTDGKIDSVDLAVPDYDKWTMVATAAMVRPFLLPKEDNYLPSVATSLRSLVTAPGWQANLDVFDQHANELVSERPIETASSAISVSTIDLGDPSSQTDWISASEMAHHFIYGHVVHEDEDRRQILARFTDDGVRFMVYAFLVKLLIWLNMARALLRRMIAAGVLGVTDPVPEVEGETQLIG